MIGFELASTWDPDFVASIKRHYTGSAGAPPGKKMAWRIREGFWDVLGWIGIGEPSFKLAPRRRLQGRTEVEVAVLAEARFLPGTVSCFIYRLECPTRVASASAILRAWHVVAAEDWAREYGWEPEHWETMIGQGAEANPGACFRRAGYRSIGLTTGRTARRPKGHSRGPRVWTDSEPKLALYRGPLARLPREAA